MLLAIDTATDWAGVALYDPRAHQVRYEITWWARRRHTTTLLPRVNDALEDQGLTPSALHGLVVAIGPGSYTGLRVGLSLAKGIVLAHAVPLVGIPTLDILAYPYRHLTSEICAVIQAGRTRVSWALYTPGDTPTALDGYHLDDVPTLARILRERARPVFVVGELTAAQVQTLREEGGPHLRLADPAEGLRRPGWLAALGHRALSEGRQDDPATLSPIYLRHPGSSAP